MGIVKDITTIKYLPHSKNYNFKDISNIKFNYLKAIGYTGKNKRGYAQWHFKCDCGNSIITTSSEVISGHTKSCGCFQKSFASTINKTHGESKSPVYKIWIGIKKRCFNKQSRRYADYGGRGVVMCNRWKDNAIAFINDIGERPSKNHSVDRINNNGNYSCGKCHQCVENDWPSNCRWATQTEQARNTRYNAAITFNGTTKCIAEWAEITGIKKDTIYCRNNRYKWCAKCTLTAPVKIGRYNSHKCTHNHTCTHVVADVSQ